MARLTLATIALLLAPLAGAQQSESNDELAAQATDPTAVLMSFQLNDWYTASFHGLDDTRVSRWAALVPGVNYGPVVSFGGQKWRPNIEAGDDFAGDPGNPTWVISLGVALLVPAL